MTPLIFFIACHGGPAPHFSEFAKELSNSGCRVKILATGPAFDKLKSLGAQEFNLKELDIDDPASQRLLAKEVANSLASASVVITDVGHMLMACVLEEISRKSPSIKRLAYYENPEPFVPGGYSKTAEKVMACANKALFSNANLAIEPLYSSPSSPIPLSLEKRVGIGYYSTETAKALENARALRKESARSQFFKERKIPDRGQKILVYLGGNNETYFEKAFPAFLQFLRESRLDPSQYLILMQHHPGDKKREIDAKLSGGYPIFVSKTPTDETLILADGVLYYQTTMSPQCALAGIPVIQVGHETYHDLLVREEIAPSACDPETFLQAIRLLAKPPQSTQLLDKLGISLDWPNRLKKCISSEI